MNITQEKQILTLTSQATSSYKYVHAIQMVTVTETSLYESNITDSVSVFTLPQDGYYIISEIMLPITNGPSNYWTDGIHIYDPFDEVISVEVLLSVDPGTTNIVREDTDYINTYALKNYYENALKSLFLKDMCNCNCTNNTKIELNILTMGIDLIELLTSTGQYYEVQRIIEKLITCIGIAELNCKCYG